MSSHTCFTNYEWIEISKIGNAQSYDIKRNLSFHSPTLILRLYRTVRMSTNNRRVWSPTISLSSHTTTQTVLHDEGQTPDHCCSNAHARPILVEWWNLSTRRISHLTPTNDNTGMPTIDAPQRIRIIVYRIRDVFSFAIRF